jgi:hypothetical protein
MKKLKNFVLITLTCSMQLAFSAGYTDKEYIPFGIKQTQLIAATFLHNCKACTSGKGYSVSAMVLIRVFKHTQ